MSEVLKQRIQEKKMNVNKRVQKISECGPVLVRGLVFDMDGLLLDSEKLVKRTWDYAGSLLGYENFGDHIYNTVGFNLKRRTRYFRENVREDFPMDWFADVTRKKYHEIAEEEGVDVKDGVMELLEYAKGKGYRIGLATSSRKIHAEQSLKSAGLFSYFDGMIFGDVVKEGKPSPEIYLRACRQIGVEPSEAVALEDAPSGVISAHTAGMRVIVVPDLVEPSEEILGLVWHRADSLAEVPSMLEEETAITRQKPDL